MDARRSRWLVAVVCLAVLLLPVSGVGAAEAPADTGESASDAEVQSEAMPDDSAGGVEVVRHAGSDPYELSIQVARALVDAQAGSSEWVVLASGESWTDAAAAGPLAASLDAPVVLVPPGGLQSPAARPDLVEFLRSAGVRRVVIVGDPEALPNHEPSVLFGLGMLPRNIERVHGTDPIGTSIAVAERIGAPAELGELGRTVIIVSDQSVADAVAVGPLAASGPFPLLLTAPDALDPRIAAYLAEQEIAHVVLVGGTAAIAPEVQQAIETSGVTVTRLAGRDRVDTARLAAELFGVHSAGDPACDEGPLRIGLAPAQQPEQALTAGPLLARACAPLRYVEPGQLPADLRNTLYLASHQTETAELHLLADATSIPGDLIDGAAFRKPPFRLAFGTQIRIGDRWEAVIALVDENRERTLLLEGERFDGTDWINWSPDGRHLAFGASQDGIWGAFLLDTATAAYRRITPASDDFYFSPWATPAWSPNGDYLAMSTQPGSSLYGYESDSEPKGTDLYVFEMQSGEVRQLTRSSEQDVHRGWSPDGEWIALERSEVLALPAGLGPWGDRAILINAKSGEATQLALDGRGISNWAWSQSGNLVAVELVEPYDLNYPTPDLAVFRADELPHAMPVEVDRKGYIYGWSHDGKYLALVSDYTAERSLSVVNSQFELVTELSLPGKRSKRNSALFRGWLPMSYQVLLEGYHSLTGSTGELVLVDVETGMHSEMQALESGMDIRQLVFSPGGSQIGAVVYEHQAAQRRIMLYRGLPGDRPIELIDISEHTPPTEEITTVHLRWLDSGIRGTIEWHYDF